MEWIRTSNRNYKTTCGRFTIQPNFGRPGYVLSDNSRQDPMMPKYGWTQHCCTIAAGKVFAEKIVRKENSQGKKLVEIL